MHIKKALGIATVTALLAVPALGTTANASTVTLTHPVKATAVKLGKYDYQNRNIGSKVFPAGTRINAHKQETNGFGYEVDGKNGVDYSIPLSDSTYFGSNKVSQKKSANVSNATSSNKPVYQNSKTNNNKLAQTGESNTKVKAGIIGVMAVMVSVAFAGVEKFFKRV